MTPIFVLSYTICWEHQCPRASEWTRTHSFFRLLQLRSSSCSWHLLDLRRLARRWWPCLPSRCCGHLRRTTRSRQTPPLMTWQSAAPRQVSCVLIKLLVFLRQTPSLSVPSGITAGGIEAGKYLYRICEYYAWDEFLHDGWADGNVNLHCTSLPPCFCYQPASLCRCWSSNVLPVCVGQTQQPAAKNSHKHSCKPLLLFFKLGSASKVMGSCLWWQRKWVQRCV